MKLLKKLTALTLCLLLFLSAAGCGGDATWVYKTGDQELSAGFYITTMINNYFLAEGKLLEQGATDYTAKDVLAAEIDGVTADAWIVEKTKTEAQQSFVVAIKAAELGVGFTEDERTNIKNYTAQVWSGQMRDTLVQYAMYTGITPEQYLLLMTRESFEKNGVSQSSLEQYFISRSISRKLFEHLYGTGGEFAVPEAEIAGEFQSKYVKAAYMVVSKEQLNGSEEDPVQAALDADTRNQELKALAESYLERLKAGEAIEELDYEYRQSKAEEGTEVTMRKKEDYEGIYYRLEESTGDTLTDTLVTATGPAIADDAYGIYIVYPLDIMEDPGDLEEYRSSLINLLKWEEYEQKLAEWGSEQSIVTNDKAISRYTPKKLKMEG